MFVNKNATTWHRLLLNKLHHLIFVNLGTSRSLFSFFSLFNQLTVVDRPLYQHTTNEKSSYLSTYIRLCRYTKSVRKCFYLLKRAILPKCGLWKRSTVDFKGKDLTRKKQSIWKSISKCVLPGAWVVAQVEERLLPDNRGPQFKSSHRRIFI